MMQYKHFFRFQVQPRALVITQCFGASRRFLVSTTSNRLEHVEQQQQQQQQQSDVVIVGGGVVGLCLARQLSIKAPELSVTVVEAGSNPINSTTNHEIHTAPLINPRSYALSPFSLQLLGLDTIKSNHRLGYYNSMQVWESGHPASLIFNETDIDGDSLGAIVEDDVIVKNLWENIQSKCNLLSNTSVTDITLPEDMNSGLATIQLQSNTTKDQLSSNSLEIQTKLLIGADGANSIVRRLTGIPRTVLEYDQHALTFTVKLHGSHGKRAFQRFLPTGPIALLPTFLDDHSIVVWSTSPTLAKQWKNNPDLPSHINSLLQDGPERVPSILRNIHSSSFPQPLMNLLYGAEKLLDLAHYGPAMLSQEQQQFPFVAPPVITSIVSQQFTFPLSCAQVHSYTAPRLALTGDAAHSIHPMAGQGLNLGLQDVANLIQVIEKANTSGMDLPIFLNEYEIYRKLQVSLTMGGIHALQRIFQNQSMTLKHTKSLGMNLIQNVIPMRKKLAEAACHGVTIPV